MVIESFQKFENISWLFDYNSCLGISEEFWWLESLQINEPVPSPLGYLSCLSRNETEFLGSTRDETVLTKPGFCSRVKAVYSYIYTFGNMMKIYLLIDFIAN